MSNLKQPPPPANVHAWPLAAGRPDMAPPPRIVRPCDYALRNAQFALETQLGTIEAYNRLATAAHDLKAKIDAGEAVPQNPLFAVSATGAQ